jgi:photosystem II stability/assembly factor-like uncharacterized protein
VAVSGVANDPMVYYMGSTGGGIWKTEDAGISWNNISDGYFSTGSAGAIAIAPSDPNIIYVGMGEHAVRGVMTSHGDGVYKSMDGGESWIHQGLLESRHIAEIEIHPENPDIAFVAVQGALHGPSEDRGVYRTTDGGQSWCQVLYLDNTTGASDLSIDPSNPRILYAAMWDHRRYPWKVRSGGPGSGLFKSVDGGENWVRLSDGLPDRMGKVAVDISPANPKVIYANIEAEKGGVFRSDDGGRTWRQTSVDRRTVARAWYYIEIFADPRDQETIYVLNEEMLKSIDGGKTFEEIATPHSDHHDLWINPQHTQNIILANDGGACITFNEGRTWSSQANQPTGQFYRVITDRRFPYSVYGGQQDNTTVAIPSRTNGAGIGWQDWYPVAGCESAFLAFDPDDPKFIYGGCYQGYIEKYNSETKESKDIMAYPALGLATNPREMKYRFNWNAPIVAQPQDPGIIYHAAHKVLRTDNGGLSWQEISPDLTRNEADKQGPGGGPFTNEGAGSENYNTISYLACSPHQAGVIWAGSDDGLLHLTRDEGASWTNVTPPGISEALIQSIEVSPHNPAVAYVVATRYRFNDFRPIIYYTDDYGKQWQKIVDGIASDHFVRVVREDPRQQGLLYAGTENGLYISFNNGAHWQEFQQNLPICPITDLQIQDNDLVAATSGRAFWILDDLSPLQQSMGRLPAGEMVLFQPKPSVRFDAKTTEEPAAGMGVNPPTGVLINYYLPRAMDSIPLTLEILDAHGRLVRNYSNQKDKHDKSYPGGHAPDPLLPSGKGLNRFNWDLRREPLPGIEGVLLFGDYKGSMVGPGIYTLRLIATADTLENTCQVLPDPRVQANMEDYTLQQEVLQRIENTVREIHTSVNRMRAVRKQVAFLTEQMKKAGCTEEVIKQGRKIEKEMTSWEENLIQPRHETKQDVINFPNRLSAEMIHLLNRVNTHAPEVTQGARQRMDDLLRQWGKYKAGYRELMEKEVARFNEIFKEKDLPVVVIPSSAD